jgi:hypothetical protein
MAAHSPTRPRCTRHSLHLEAGDEVCWHGRWFAVLDFTQGGDAVVELARGVFEVLDLGGVTAWRQAPLASGGIRLFSPAFFPQALDLN